METVFDPVTINTIVTIIVCIVIIVTNIKE